MTMDYEKIIMGLNLAIQSEVGRNFDLKQRIKELDKELEYALHLRDIHRESAQYFEGKLRELREGIEKLEEKSQNITDESDSWGCVHYESLMELYKLIEGDKLDKGDGA